MQIQPHNFSIISLWRWTQSTSRLITSHFSFFRCENNSQAEIRSQESLMMCCLPRFGIFFLFLCTYIFFVCHHDAIVTTWISSSNGDVASVNTLHLIAIPWSVIFGVSWPSNFYIRSRRLSELIRSCQPWDAEAESLRSSNTKIAKRRVWAGHCPEWQLTDKVSNGRKILEAQSSDYY